VHKKCQLFILLAMNEDGCRNLMKLASVAQTEGFYYKPRISRRLLADHHEGLIALSACLHGEVPWLISHSGMDAARQKALELQQLFGDRRHPGAEKVNQPNCGVALAYLRCLTLPELSIFGKRIRKMIRATSCRLYFF